MAPDPMTRRRLLQGAGTAVAATLAGCNGGTQSTPTDTSTSTGTPTGNATGSTGTQPENVSQYTEVYRDVIGSVVLIQTSSAEGQGGQGSGFVYQDNYIVTNAHVVSGASEVQVRFTEGEWRPASIVGVDPSSDLAVLEVENPPNYAKPLPMVNEVPPIGTKVVAIGSPYGLEGSVTSGLISGINRSIPAPNGYSIPDAIQTGAPVNPGNSGGPLLNLNGRVVGVINSGGGDNLAFAISAPLVKRVVPSLIENGEYQHASLGVALRTVTPSVAEELNLEEPRGVVVTGVRSGGPADGTLQQGDVIVSIEGNKIDSTQQLGSYLALQASPGDTVQLAVIRDGERQTVEVTLGARQERTPSQSR